MKTRMKRRTMLLYVFQPEDTTADGAWKPGDGWAVEIPAWLGALKTVFWSMIAITAPIVIAFLGR